MTSGVAHNDWLIYKIRGLWPFTLDLKYTCLGIGLCVDIA